MSIYDIVLMVIALVGSWMLWRSARGVAAELRMIRRCTVSATARIVSWRVLEHAEESSDYIPTIRYSFDGRDYETELDRMAVTKPRKERDFAGDALTVFIDPAQPTNIIHEDRSAAMLHALGNGAVFGCISLALLLALILLIPGLMR